MNTRTAVTFKQHIMTNMSRDGSSIGDLVNPVSYICKCCPYPQYEAQNTKLMLKVIFWRIMNSLYVLVFLEEISK